MILLVLSVAVLNLALGFAVAMALSASPPWSGWSIRVWKSKQGNSAASEESAASTAEAGEAGKSGQASSSPAVSVAGVDELPPQWLEQLASSGIYPLSYVEGAAHAMRLDVGQYREQLLTIETRVRASQAASDGEALRLTAEDLGQINRDWLEKQTFAAKMLSQRAGRLGDYEEQAKAVERVLLDQAAEIGDVATALGGLEFVSDPDRAGRGLLEQIAKLVDSAHALRDRLQDLLAILLRTSRRLNSVGANIQLDHLTGIPNRIGAEILFDAWWMEDPDRSRLLSAALVDVDRFSRVNERLGTRGGDRAITALGKLFFEMVQKDREFDRLARLGGQTFLVIFGDAGPHNGLAAMERVRQTVEATTFDDQGATFELTVSCGVVEVGRRETVIDVIRRAQQTLAFAKKSGRNRCTIDEGAGPVLLPPPPLAVQGRVVNLGDE